MGKLKTIGTSGFERKNFLRIIFVVLSALFVNNLVYYTGGTNGAWAQLNIFLIVMAAYYWGVKGSVLLSIILGIITGPFMPLDVTNDIMQSTYNWMFRLFIYVFLGVLIGYLLTRNKKLNEDIKQKDSVTRLYNTNRLLNDLDKRIKNKEEFCVIFINIANLEEISKYVSYDIVDKIMYNGINELKKTFCDSFIYSASFKEYIVSLNGYDYEEAVNRVNECFDKLYKSMKANGYSIRLVTKVGIACCSDEDNKGVNIYNKARIAADQGDKDESGVYIYDKVFEKNERLLNEVAGSLPDAINNDEFNVVYQPIVNIKNSSIIGAETLLRWDRGDREKVGPDIFIDVAERIGLITKVSIWVVEHSVNQIVEWKKLGLNLKFSINVTSQEILDESFRSWAIEFVKNNNLDERDLSIEITERVFSTDEDKLISILNDLRSQGFSVSIDDFGTGYNSLITIGNIPSDVIKIDKYFMDKIDKMGIRLLVKYIIEASHEIGKVVIAEGVETKAQMELLKSYGCDMIQGYYFSKPLSPEDFLKYYNNFKGEDYGI